ncbi:hypothetical protein DFP72DRAFT_1068356 [Ephemerocybe angulata]|uniref:Uncharacterized protein n=1 Tax=Ephemerocybe angulata TaxID=980116 RepID=A0A8H6HYR4_9AGAR|nr:hypothetical protein DFP72DRAFT_1068356 [Tulosesus angulatus]
MDSHMWATEEQRNFIVRELSMYLEAHRGRRPPSCPEMPMGRREFVRWLMRRWFCRWPMDVELAASGVLPQESLDPEYNHTREESRLYAHHTERKELQIRELIREERRRLIYWRAKEGVFIDGKLQEFMDAVTSGRKAQRRFWPPTFAGWFEKFPLLPELVAAELLGPQVLETDYEMTKEEASIYTKQLEVKKGQIKTVLRYRRSKLVGDVGVSTGKRSAVTKATQHFVKRGGRCHQRGEVYGQLYKAKVDVAFNEEMAARAERRARESGESEMETDGTGSSSGSDEDTGGGSLKDKKRGSDVHIRNEIARRLFKKAPDEEKDEVERLIAAEREEKAAKVASDAELVGFKRPAKDRHESLQNAPGFMVANAQTLWDTTAAVTLQIAIAPDPLREGRLWSRVIAFGKDSSGKLFTQSYPNFQDEFVSPFYIWARDNIYNLKTPLPIVSPEELSSDALNIKTDSARQSSPPPSPEPQTAPVKPAAASPPKNSTPAETTAPPPTTVSPAEPITSRPPVQPTPPLPQDPTKPNTSRPMPVQPTPPPPQDPITVQQPPSISPVPVGPHLPPTLPSTADVPVTDFRFLNPSPGQFEAQLQAPYQSFGTPQNLLGQQGQFDSTSIGGVDQAPSNHNAPSLPRLADILALLNQIQHTDPVRNNYSTYSTGESLGGGYNNFNPDEGGGSQLDQFRLPGFDPTDDTLFYDMYPLPPVPPAPDDTLFDDMYPLPPVPPAQLHNPLVSTTRPYFSQYLPPNQHTAADTPRTPPSNEPPPNEPPIPNPSSAWASFTSNVVLNNAQGSKLEGVVAAGPVNAIVTTSGLKPPTIPIPLEDGTEPRNSLEIPVKKAAKKEKASGKAGKKGDAPEASKNGGTLALTEEHTEASGGRAKRKREIPRNPDGTLRDPAGKVSKKTADGTPRDPVSKVAKTKKAAKQK